MKKAILICLFIGTAITGQAQVTIQPGIRGGINFSKFTNAETDRKADFFIGGLLAIKFTKFYALQPELTYSRQGAKETYYYTDFDPTFDPFVNSRTRRENKYSLDYLSLGIINKFTFGPGFQVMVGPSLDFKVSDNFASYAVSNPQDFDLSLVAGVGFVLKNGLAFDVRIKQGLIDIFGYDYNNNYYYDENGSYYNDYTVDDVVLNQVIQIGVSYSFKMK